MVSVCQSNVVLFSFHCIRGGLRMNGGFPLNPLSWVPRSTGNQILLPFAWRGPSQILSIAWAWAGVRQLGSLEAPPFAEQISAGILALNLQVRGSSMMPSVTPSLASQAAIAALVA